MNQVPTIEEFLYTDEYYSIINKLKGADITPSIENIFNFIIPLDEIKVIILGQDPYYDGNADGLAFSCKKKLSPSLRNIYKALNRYKLIGNEPKSNLHSWRKQGVLLLNVALTTLQGVAGAHLSLWRPYTMTLINRIVEQVKATHGYSPILIAWGSFAEKCSKNINTDIKLYWSHPSPLNTNGNFSECSNFIDSNFYLLESGRPPIIWGSICNQMRPQNIFTDGSSSGGNKKDKNTIGGYSCVFTDGPIWAILAGRLDTSVEFASNIRAEGYAILRALEISLYLPNTIINIFTDSEFWINMLYKYIPKWSANTIESKKNADLVKKLWNVFLIVKKKHSLSIIYVPAHNKTGWRESSSAYKQWCHAMNDLADKYAGIGRELLKEKWFKKN